MKKYQYIIAALLAIAACQKNGTEPEVIEEEPVWGYVKAQVDDDSTKAILVDDGSGKLDFQWSEGDKITIRVKKTDDSYANKEGIVDSVSDGIATIKFDATDAVEITNAWYPLLASGGAPPVALKVNQDYSAGHISIPLRAHTKTIPIGIEDGDRGENLAIQGTLRFETYNPGANNYSVVGYRLRKEDGHTGRILSSIKVNNGSQDYTLTNINTVLIDEEQCFYIVLPSSDEAIPGFKATFTFKDDANQSYEYSRTKLSYTPTARKVTRMPVIEDKYDLGKYVWKLGNAGSTYPEGMANASIVRSNPFTTPTDGDAATTVLTLNDGYVTVKTGLSSGKYRGDYATLSRPDSHVYYGYSKLVESTLTPFVKKDDSKRITVHAGKYPIVAVKMTNLEKVLKGSSSSGYYGATGYSPLRFTVDSNSSENDSRRYVDGPVWESANVIGNVTNWNAKPAVPGDDVLVYYFYLTGNKFSIGGNNNQPFPTDKAIALYKFDFRVADIVSPASAPEFKVYWIGTFSSTEELATFAATH